MLRDKSPPEGATLAVFIRLYVNYNFARATELCLRRRSFRLSAKLGRLRNMQVTVLRSHVHVRVDNRLDIEHTKKKNTILGPKLTI